MHCDDSRPTDGVPFTGEYLKRYEELFLAKGNEIKAWRAREAESGKPSRLADYFYVHGFCPDCHGVGIAGNEDGMGFKAVGWNGRTQLFQKFEICDGSGVRVGGSSS